MQDLRVTLVQADLAWEQPSVNREQFGHAVRELGSSTDLVVLPEMFTTGFSLDAERLGEPPGGETERWLDALANECGVAICGSVIVRDGGRAYNRLFWASPGKPVGRYDKRHLYRLGREHEHYTAGTERQVFELKGWRVCPLICYDLRFPVWSRGANAFELLIYVANWPAARRSAWNAMLPARAVENQCYSIGVNRAGVDGKGVVYSGDSAAYDFLGDARAVLGDGARSATVTLEREALDRYREKFPAYLDADRFQIDPDE